MNNIAQTIYTQIGHHARVMLGTTKFIAGQFGLSFHIGRNPKNITHIRISLTAQDLYDVEFLRLRKMHVKTVKCCPLVFADDLLAVIEANTGLRTSLGTMASPS